MIEYTKNNVDMQTKKALKMWGLQGYINCSLFESLMVLYQEAIQTEILPGFKKTRSIAYTQGFV